LKNILVLNYEFPPLGGGAASVSYEIAKRYVLKGYKVDVVTMGYEGLPSFEIINGINIYRVKCLRKRKETCETHELFTYILSAIFVLIRRLKKCKYDFCHCHSLIPSGIIALFLKKRYGLNYIVTIHGSDIPGYNNDRFQFEHLFTKPLLKIIGSNAKFISSPSLFLKDLAMQKIGKLNIVHIPNGIDLDWLNLNFVKPKEKIILSTGRLLERKGFQTLINAVKDIELPYEVNIAGDGPYRKQLKKLAKRSKTKIVFHGWLDKGSIEFKDLYEKASIYVLASSKENASIALLEGMAARCAVISTNVSGCPETIGNAGFLIDFNDADALKQILIDLCYDKKIVEEFAQQAYDRVISYFLWDKIVDMYVAILI